MTGADLARLSGFWTDLATIAEVLAEAQRSAHLISPATSAPALLPGTAIATSLVLVDVERETYPALSGRGVALKKEALDRIASAAGVSWDHPVVVLEERDRIVLSVRGSVTQFDGTPRTIEGTYELDLRDGSALVAQMIDDAIEKEREWLQKNRRQGDPVALGRARAERSIRQKRTRLVSLADTGARLRAVRSLGVRQAYDAAELAKPFVAAKLVFTGRTGHADLDERIAEKVADRFLGATDALFGGRRAAAPEPVRKVPAEVRDAPPAEKKPAPAPAAAPASPPPATTSSAPPPAARAPQAEPTRRRSGYDVERAADQLERAAGLRDEQPAARDVPRGTSAPRGRSFDDARAASSPDRPRSSFDLKLPKKGGGGPLLADAEDEDLAYWHDRLSDTLEKGEARYPEKDEALRDAIAAELDWREGAEGGR